MLIWQLVLQAILIAINAFFASAEIAVVSVNDAKLEKMAEDGDKRAKKLVKLTSQPTKFLSTIQVAITLAGFLGSAFAAENFSDSLVGWVLSMGVNIPAATLDSIAVILITLILSFLTIVLGELVPKRLAMKNPEGMALAIAGIISLCAKLFSPIVFVLNASTNGILRIFGIDPNEQEEEVSEEEIRMMVDVGEEKGTIDAREKEIINNLFEFDDLAIGDFVTHRTDLTLLWTEDSPLVWENIILETRHSLYPVCGESVDDIIGILNIKDFFAIKADERSQDNIIKKAVKPAFFVPENMKADVLFKQMKTRRHRFAIVLDEYGGVLGAVTLYDLLEQIVGDFDVEGIEEEPEGIKEIGENQWLVTGNLSLEEIEEAIDGNLPTEEYDTLGGLVFEQKGFIPEDGTQFEIETEWLYIKVLEIENHRLEKAVISKIITEEETDDE
ncbi:MAG: HlyC/CorC family transporter [Ruminococcaceae bacterium]|nr:HlyC/CorC family transporter [Oscillospiraceae bacterium]